MAARPLGTSANFNPADGDRKPGNLPVILGQPYTIGQCKVIMCTQEKPGDVHAARFTRSHSSNVGQP